MVQLDDTKAEQYEQSEFDFYLQFEWPEHIETALRRMIWISLVEASERTVEQHSHTNYLRWLLATHPETPSIVLEFIARIGDCKLLERISEHQQASAITLRCLAQSEHASVRSAVAENSATPIDVLLQLIQDENPDVRYRMAENHALPATMLQQLCDDANVYVAARARKTLCRRSPATVQHLSQRQRRVSEERKLG